MLFSVFYFNHREGKKNKHKNLTLYVVRITINNGKVLFADSTPCLTCLSILKYVGCINKVIFTTHLSDIDYPSYEIRKLGEVISNHISSGTRYNEHIVHQNKNRSKQRKIHKII